MRYGRLGSNKVEVGIMGWGWDRVNDSFSYEFRSR